ncbi:hypothetical protein MTO96_002641 [Rhipicephalus appendiculatus]
MAALTGIGRARFSLLLRWRRLAPGLPLRRREHAARAQHPPSTRGFRPRHARSAAVALGLPAIVILGIVSAAAAAVGQGGLGALLRRRRQPREARATLTCQRRPCASAPGARKGGAAAAAVPVPRQRATLRRAPHQLLLGCTPFTYSLIQGSRHVRC